LKQLEAAQKSIRQAQQIDEENKETRQLSLQIQKQINFSQVTKLKLEAAQLMKEQQPSNALELYKECLKLLDQEDVLEYLAVLLNTCACYLALKQFEDIISNCLRGLKIIRGHKNKILTSEFSKMTKEQKDTINSFEVRFLIRRANAYIS